MLLILTITCTFFLTGCFGKKETDIVKILTKKVEQLKSYHIVGILEVINNENTYKYDIDVSYKKDDNFRVSLKNKTNDHEQIILKNSNGVFVLTPSLNKSFKFQSEWPYNNSQSYLLQTILEDIKIDEKRKIEEKNGEYIITTKVNYSNNKELQNQKIYLDKKGVIKRVEVMNSAGIIKMKMTYKSIDEGAKFDKDYFDLSKNMSLTTKTEKTSKEIEDIIYPLYMPKNTYLEKQETVSTEGGERVILTFAGESPFTIIEETVKPEEYYTTVPVHGELEILNDVLGSITDGTASWISNGIEYYAVSDIMDSSELLEVVNSVSAIPIGK